MLPPTYQLKLGILIWESTGTDSLLESQVNTNWSLQLYYRCIVGVLRHSYALS